jgi:rRNA maturation endonuclease Nob1
MNIENIEWKIIKNTEMCEWKILKDMEITNFIGNTGCSESLKNIEINFCPFCGKKIKRIFLFKTLFGGKDW